jgi:hypothetical protein
LVIGASDFLASKIKVTNPEKDPIKPPNSPDPKILEEITISETVSNGNFTTTHLQGISNCDLLLLIGYTNKTEEQFLAFASHIQLGV